MMFLSNLLSGSVQNYYLEGGSKDNIVNSLVLQELIRISLDVLNQKE